MPQCPICNAAVWVGQQYCSTCINPLPQAEKEDYFCPQCGIRMTTQQETCQSCKVPLPEIAGTFSTAPARAWRLPFRVPGIFIGAGSIIVALFLFFPFHKSPEPPQLVMTPPASQAASGQSPITLPIPASETAPAAPAIAAVQEVAVSPAPAASSPPAVATPTPSLPRYFVNTHELTVRDGPNMDASQIATLNFKDEVELLDTSGGWGRVRDAGRNIVGWSFMRYLQPLADAGPRAVSQYQPATPK